VSWAARCVSRGWYRRRDGVRGKTGTV